MFKGLINDVKSAAASFLGTYLARASVAVPFLVALGFATAAIALELTERFGARNALWILAGGFCAIGLLAALAVTMKEQQQEMEAAEEQERNAGGIGDIGIGEMTSAASAAATAAATQAASHVPAALLGALLQNPSASALPVARMVGRNMPLLVLLALVALLLWPTEQTEESAAQQDDTAATKPGASEDEPLQEAA